VSAMRVFAPKEFCMTEVRILAVPTYHTSVNPTVNASGNLQGKLFLKYVSRLCASLSMSDMANSEPSRICRRTRMSSTPSSHEVGLEDRSVHELSHKARSCCWSHVSKAPGS
jgi:hypothetical protein